MNPPRSHLSKAILAALESSGKPMTIAQIVQAVGRTIPTPQAIGRYRKKKLSPRGLHDQAAAGRRMIVGNIAGMMAKRGKIIRVSEGTYALRPAAEVRIYQPPAEAG